MHMKCSKARRKISLYMDGELESNDKVLLKLHLVQCNRCAKEFEEIERLHSLFAHADRFSAPQGFSMEVMLKVNDYQSRSFSLSSLFVRFAQAAAVLLAISLGTIPGDLFMNTLSLHQKEEIIITSFSLDIFEALPPDSLGGAYLTMTEGRNDD
jgi:predicted anti-sigma-YlaC factor YlaD